ncbi:hypothetical protein ACFL0C_01755 [Patescibacteria group bacterium]
MPQQENITSLSADELEKKADDLEKGVNRKRNPEIKRNAMEDAKLKMEGWKDDVEKADKIPSTTEVAQAYNGSFGHERFKLSDALLKKALDQEGVQNRNLGFAKEIGSPPLHLEGQARNPADSEKPQTWFKQVKETRGVFRRREHATDEVIVVSRMNNEADDNRNLVVIRMAKQEGGNIVEGTGFSSIITQEKYQKIVESDPKDLTGAERLMKDMLEGKTTIKQHKKNFKKYMGKPPDKFWKNENKRVSEDGPTRWKSEQTYGKLLEQIETDYTEQLQVLADKLTGVEGRINRNQEALDNTLESVKSMAGFEHILKLYKNAKSRGASTEAKWKSTLMEYGLTEQQVEALA